MKEESCNCPFSRGAAERHHQMAKLAAVVMIRDLSEPFHLSVVSSS